VEQAESGEGSHRNPDGPPPAREQLPLPRRRRQSHLEPQLRTPGGAGSGTPFAAFAADSRDDSAATGPNDRVAAFHAGTRRGRGNARARRPNAGTRRPEPGPPPVRRSEH
jgi:hypothetical protein